MSNIRQGDQKRFFHFLDGLVENKSKYVKINVPGVLESFRLKGEGDFVATFKVLV